MPRRTLTSATSTSAAPSIDRDSSLLPQSDPTYADNLRQLRTTWKWAAFSQFFYTFARLLAMPDVTLMDIEDDLVRSTTLYLPRIMHRLLYTLTQDRKITMDNWQSALRKQYMKRLPKANPLGPEPVVVSRDSEEPSDVDEFSRKETSAKSEEGGDSHVNDIPIPRRGSSDEPSVDIQTVRVASAVKAEPVTDTDALVTEEDKDDIKQNLEEERQDLEESVDWLDLPMFGKLESLHLLTEWQFQTPHRLRTLMKDDDEAAQWRIEPIGYDAKTNAYWLVGRTCYLSHRPRSIHAHVGPLSEYRAIPQLLADRLWIQRAPPKSARPSKRKRQPAASTVKASMPSSSNIAEDQSDNSDTEPPTTKRRRGGRPTRGSSRRRMQESPVTINDSRSRAAKVRANKKLDAQAKELAEFQRQAAQEQSSPSSLGRGRRRGGMPPSPPRKAVLGTRASARLRGSIRGVDDEWQEIPEEWLKEPVDGRGDVESESRRKTRSRGKGKGKETDASDDAAQTKESDDEGGGDRETGMNNADDTAAELKVAFGEDGDSSELTELSDEPDESDAGGEVDLQPTRVCGRGSTRGRGRWRGRGRGRERNRGGGGGRRKSSKTNGDQLSGMASEGEGTVETSAEELPPPTSNDFIEWELICVTLSEWEHVADRFENATHYLEKALYKVLSQTIVPAVTAELREIERKRKLEEAIVHRKRSSRIALKEVEKEEARIVAKKRAEEAEKEARTRRLEARAKKEDAEREKRERAREERRLEREEREERARMKQERSRSRASDVSNHPVVDGRPAVDGDAYTTSSVRLSHVQTATGVRTPEWILDCEICGKQGINLDDGLPMVCCGSCSRWQHITCHNRADYNAGRPRRNWDVGQFYCQRCRVENNRRIMQSTSRQRPILDHQYSSSHLHSQKSNATYPPQNVYSQPVSDLRYSQAQGLPFDNVARTHQQYPRGNVSSQAVTYSRPQHSHASMTYAHYQSAQPEYSNSPAMSSSSHPSVSPMSGYPMSNGQPLRSQQSMPYVPQYSNDSYSSRRPSVSQDSTLPYPSYGRTISQESHVVPNARWNGGMPERYPSVNGSIGYQGPDQEAYTYEGYLQGSSSARGSWLPDAGMHTQGNMAHQGNIDRQSLNHLQTSIHNFPAL